MPGITMMNHLNINGESPLLKSLLIYIKEMFLILFKKQIYLTQIENLLVWNGSLASKMMGDTDPDL